MLHRRGSALLFICLCLLWGTELVIAENAASSQFSFECSTLLFDISWVHVPPRYNAVIEVRNTGDCAILLGYSELCVEDASGHLVAVENSSAVYHQPSILAPGECGYYHASTIELPVSLEEDMEYRVVISPSSIRPANANDLLDCSIEDVSFPEGDYSEIIGRVINPADEYLEAVDVLWLGLNADGDVVSAAGTMIDVPAGGSSVFDIMNYSALQRNDICNYQMIARKVFY